jgi:hypothetical protein
MPSLTKRLLTFSLFLSFIVSCGDAFMKKSEDKESRFTKFAKCKTDTKALANIFKLDIEPELKCLGINLDLFMDVVKTDRPGYLSLKELKIYIQKNIQGVEQSVFDLLEAVFDINSVILGDDPAYIKRESVSKLVDLFVEVNTQMVKHNVLAFYSEKKKISFMEHNARKSRVFEALSEIGNKIIKISKANNNKIDFAKFLSKFKNVDSDPGVKKVLENLPKLLYIKKVFLGGNTQLLNSFELRRLAGMLPDIAKISFDLSSLDIIEKSGNDVEELLETLSVGARSLSRNLFYPGPSSQFPEGSSEKVMTLQDLFNTAEIFTDPYDPKKPDAHISKWFKYKKEFLLTKELLLGSSDSSFTGGEVQILFQDIISHNLERSVQVYQSYRFKKNEIILNSGDKITKPLDKTSNSLAFEKMMNRIVQNYVLFKGKDPTGFYSNTFKRSPLGISQIAVLENIIGRVFRGKAKYSLKKFSAKIDELQSERVAVRNNENYTRREKKEKDKEILTEIALNSEKKKKLEKDQGRIEGKYIKQEVIVSLFSDYSDFLLDNDLVTRNRESNTAETITLMTSLFQAQSNGDSNISVAEMTEFAIQLMSGMDSASLGQEYFSKACTNVEPNKKKPARFMPDCFRKNFSTFLESEKNEVKLVDQLDGLVRFMNKDEDTSDRYLRVVESFTRSCTNFKDGTEIPYTEGEMLLVFTGMYAVEQTFVRFDKNWDGELAGDEVDEAFEVFKPAIEALIPVDVLKGQSKDFFLYLLKYQKLPEVETKGKGIRGFFRAIKEGFKLVGFLFFRSDENKRSIATRETIATILGVLSDLSPEKQKNPFPCHTLGLEYENEQEIETTEAITQ